MVRGNQVAPSDPPLRDEVTRAALASQDYKLKGPWTFVCKERVQCLCEGGRWCNREDPAKQKGGNPVPGIHGSWVGDHVLAMARPWQSNVQKLNLPASFVQNNIGLIVNLQEVGEHDNCGPGNLRHTGFSYDPEWFMAAGVNVYNICWRDMGVPDLSIIMDAVQAMDHVISQGQRVAVHCHAGLGRTGLAIACYLVYSRQHDATGAVQFVRYYRPGALQTAKQVMFVQVFEQYLQHLRCVYKGLPQSQSAAPVMEHMQLGPPERTRPMIDSMIGPPVSVKEAGGMQTAVYGSGLTVVRPAKPISSSRKGRSHATPGDSEGTPQEVPWDDKLQIQTAQVSDDFQAAPPRSYQEALARQRRMLHGDDKAAFKHLHKLLKEVCFFIMGVAKLHQPPPPGVPPLPPLPSSNRGASQEEGTSVSAGGRPYSFAGAFASCIRLHQHGDLQAADIMAQVAMLPGFQQWVGAPGAWPELMATSLPRLKQAANAGEYGALQGQPLMLLLLLLHDFLHGFKAPCWSPEGLQHMAAVYEGLHYLPSSHPEALQFVWETEVLQRLCPEDQELCLLASALLRHMSAASGPGYEADMVAVGRWLVALLLGQQLAGRADLAEAAQSFLWYLLTNDVAYASLLLCKAARAENRPRVLVSHEATAAAMAVTMTPAIATRQYSPAPGLSTEASASGLLGPPGAGAGPTGVSIAAAAQQVLSADPTRQMDQASSSRPTSSGGIGGGKVVLPPLRRSGSQVLRQPGHLPPLRREGPGPSPELSGDLPGMPGADTRGQLDVGPRRGGAAAPLPPLKSHLAGTPTVVVPPRNSGNVDVHNVWI